MEQNPVVALFLALGIIIVAARAAGGLARRFGQPRVLGELIIGVILGPSLLNMLGWAVFHGAELANSVSELAEIGVLLLMFIIGLEVNLQELAKVGSIAILAGVLGALLPVAFTVPAAQLFGFAWQPALFAGVTLAATSVSISAQVLLELGHLRSTVGNALLATALVDDILALLLVSITIAIVGSGAQANSSAGDLILIVVRMLAFLVIGTALAWYGLPRIMEWISRHAMARQSFGIPAFALVFMLLFAWAAEALGGVATITGAFIAGVGLSRTRENIRNEIEEAASFTAYAFLVPVFFVNVGLQTDLRVFRLSMLPLALVLLVLAIISKVGGSGIGARLGGFDNRKSLQLGVCMISRGEVGLIIASLGISTGVFAIDDPLYASVFLVILLTTVVTPVLVRQIFPRHEESQAAPAQETQSKKRPA